MSRMPMYHEQKEKNQETYLVVLTERGAFAEDEFRTEKQNGVEEEAERREAGCRFGASVDVDSQETEEE